MGQKYASTIFTLLLISICIVVVQEVNLALEVNKQEDLNKNSKEELQQELQERLENKKTRDNIYEDLNLDAFDSTNYDIHLSSFFGSDHTNLIIDFMLEEGEKYSVILIDLDAIDNFSTVKFFKTLTNDLLITQEDLNPEHKYILRIRNESGMPLEYDLKVTSY